VEILCAGLLYSTEGKADFDELEKTSKVNVVSKVDVK
jgi:hypothetical protein